MRVDIDLLGSFSVAVDGRAVPEQAWRRRTAASLVKLLSLQPAGRLPREQLVDALWPDLLLEQAAPRLHKAAHYARTAMDSPRGVVLSEDAVSLFPEAQVVVDVQAFERAADDFETSGDPAYGVQAADR